MQIIATVISMKNDVDILNSKNGIIYTNDKKTKWICTIS